MPCLDLCASQATPTYLWQQDSLRSLSVVLFPICFNDGCVMINVIIHNPKYRLGIGSMFLRDCKLPHSTQIQLLLHTF